MLALYCHKVSALFTDAVDCRPRRAKKEGVANGHNHEAHPRRNLEEAGNPAAALHACPADPRRHHEEAPGDSLNRPASVQRNLQTSTVSGPLSHDMSGRCTNFL